MNLRRIAGMTKKRCWQVCVAFAVFQLWASSASAKMARLQMEIIQMKTGQWSYVINDNTRLKSDAELADFFMKLRFIQDAYLLSMHSAQLVPIDQIMKILEMAKKNPEAGIVLGSIECGPFSR
jgi:hypothetical protein